MITAAIGGALLSGALLGAGAANADAYYKNCTAAWDAGVAPLHEGDDGYEAPRLDRDERRYRLRNRSPVEPRSRSPEQSGFSSFCLGGPTIFGDVRLSHEIQRA